MQSGKQKFIVHGRNGERRCLNLNVSHEILSERVINNMQMMALHRVHSSAGVILSTYAVTFCHDQIGFSTDFYNYFLSAFPACFTTGAFWSVMTAAEMRCKTRHFCSVQPTSSYLDQLATAHTQRCHYVHMQNTLCVWHRVPEGAPKQPNEPLQS